MICYESDIIEKGVSIHTSTKNLSFLRMYYLYKKMGVKNNKFHLALIDRDLAHIDPHNLKDDSVELKMKILIEARSNPWYYFREIMRMSHSGAIAPFGAHRANIAMIWLFLQSIDQIVLLPRQKGKTTAAIACYSYMMYVHNYRTRMAMLTKDDVLRVDNVSRLMNMRDNLPDWFVQKQAKDKSNAEFVSYDVLKNEYHTFINKASQLDADKVGRGSTNANQHWDEFAFFKNNFISFPAAMFGMNAAVKEAKKNNQLHGIIITTTAGLLSTREGKYVFENYIMDSLKFNEHLYDIGSTQKLREVMDKNSRAGIVHIEFNPYQLGDTPEMVKEQIRKVANEEGTDVVKRDFFNIWLYAGKGATTLPEKTIEKLKQCSTEPLWVEEQDGYLLYWYLPQNVIKGSLFKKIPVVVGFDGSENVNRDYTTMVIQDARNMEVIGRMSCNETNNAALGLFVARFLIQYPNMLFVPERNSIGVSIIDAVLLEFQKRRINPFLRIWNTYVEDEVRDIHTVKSYSAIEHLIDSKRKEFGFRTGATSRNFLYKNTFSRALEHNFDKIKDATIVNEFIGLKIKNGRIDHSSDTHDDHVVAYLLGCYVLFFSTKLHIYFSDDSLGFEPLCSYVESGNAKKEDDFDISEYDDILNEIKRLEEEFKSTTYDIKKSQLIQQIRMYKEYLPKEVLERRPSIKTVNELMSTDTHISTDIEDTYSVKDTLEYIRNFKEMTSMM